MKVRVSTRRKSGRPLAWNEEPTVYEGTLLCTRRSNDERMAIVMFVTDMTPDSPSLFEPRLVSVFGHELRFIGLEKDQSAWVLQEWNCEILSR